MVALTCPEFVFEEADADRESPAAGACGSIHDSSIDQEEQMAEMTRSRATVAVVQMDCRTLDKSANLQRVRELLKGATADGRKVDLVVLPEGFSTGFSLGEEFYAAAEPVPGPTTEAMGEVARSLAAYVVVHLIEKGSAKGVLYNTAVLLDRQGGEVGRYRKMHLPSFGVSGQKKYFTPGDSYPVFDTDFGKLGLTICYDRTFPEVMRTMRLRGAQVLLNINAITTPAAFWWDPFFRSRAIENQAYVIAVNRAGPAEGNPGVKYYGHSLVADYKGQIIAEAGEGDEVILAEIDIEQLEAQRNAVPYITDRRPETYSLLTRPSEADRVISIPASGGAPAAQPDPATCRSTRAACSSDVERAASYIAPG